MGTRNSIHQLIHTSPVALIAMKNVRCTIAAQSRLEHANVCYKSRIFTDPDSKLWAYMKCLHPETNMHSYVYIGGEYHGDGFSLLQDNGDPRGAGISDADLHAKLEAAGAVIDANKCGAAGKCKALNLITDEVRTKMETTIAKAPVVLYGWGGCPCTNDARTRFRQNGVCYVETVWPDTNDPLFRYLQCVYGDENHSFVFIGGKFIGDGFVLARKAQGGMSKEHFEGLLAGRRRHHDGLDAQRFVQLGPDRRRLPRGVCHHVGQVPCTECQARWQRPAQRGAGRRALVHLRVGVRQRSDP